MATQDKDSVRVLDSKEQILETVSDLSDDDLMNMTPYELATFNVQVQMLGTLLDIRDCMLIALDDLVGSDAPEQE